MGVFYNFSRKCKSPCGISTYFHRLNFKIIEQSKNQKNIFSNPPPISTQISLDKPIVELTPYLPYHSPIFYKFTDSSLYNPYNPIHIAIISNNISKNQYIYNTFNIFIKQYSLKTLTYQHL